MSELCQACRTFGSPYLGPIDSRVTKTIAHNTGQRPSAKLLLLPLPPRHSKPVPPRTGNRGWGKEIFPLAQAGIGVLVLHRLASNGGACIKYLGQSGHDVERRREASR
jgi:hypothetical protein